MKTDITCIPVCLIGSDVCVRQRNAKKGQYQVQLEEESRGEVQLIKMEEISERERDIFLEDFPFALDDWG